jgi:hypothetical protein
MDFTASVLFCSQVDTINLTFVIVRPMNDDISLPPVRIEANIHDHEAPEGAAFIVLGPQSPLEWQKATTTLAYYFKDEFRYDFEPYSYHESQVNPSPENKDRHGWLPLDHTVMTAITKRML